MDRLIERMEGLQRGLLAILVASLIILISVQVIVRYIVQKPWFLWSEELSRFLLIWLVFLGIGLGIKQGSHFAMDIVPSLMGRRIVRIANLFGHVCMGLILILLILAGVRFASFGLRQRSPIMGLQMFFVFVSLPLGGALSLIYLFWKAKRAVKEDPE